MIACFCVVNTDEDIAEAIDTGARTVEEVGERCGAGTGCGSCHEFIRDLLESRADTGACMGMSCGAACAGVQQAAHANLDSREAA